MSRRCMTVLAVLLAAAPALATGQSMAEAARKEKERREKAAAQKEAKKDQAYTDSDLATAGGGSGTANILSGPSPTAAAPSAARPSLAEARAAAEARAGAPAAAGTGAAGVASIQPTPGASGEAYWRSRAAGVRQRVTAAQTRLAAADRAMAEFTFGPPEGGGCDGLAESAYRSGGIEGVKKMSTLGCKDRAMLWHERRNRAANEFDAAKIELENARKALDGLDEEARRGGALPGWIR